MYIDFVIPWVDGTDPEWIQLRDSCIKDDTVPEECRFRDWGILKYWFRAVEEYAPWVHMVHFVTCGQIPSWLNTNHPKLHIVDHRDYLPHAYLPTFSSHTIELNLHRIESLSEHFVYFNDDMFLNRPVSPEDFFQNKLPCDSAVMDSFAATGTPDAYMHAQCNVMAFINEHFNKHQVLHDRPDLWFSPKYGKYILKNTYYYLPRDFSAFQNAHIPSSMLKSTFDTVWELAPELLHNTCQHRFRDFRDVNQYIMSYYNLCTGKFVPRSPYFGKCYRVGLDNGAMHNDILNGTHKVICINDHPGVIDFENQKRLLIPLYQKKLPRKCSFER